jgi:hypothetical protein
MTSPQPLAARISTSLLGAALLCGPLVVAAPAAADDAEAPAKAKTTEGDAEAGEPTGAEKSGKQELGVGGLGKKGDSKVVASAEDDDDAPFPVSMSVSLGSYLGSGTFVPGYAGNPYVANSLGLSPALSFDDWSFSASQGFDLEWTQSDSTTYQNQIMWSDTGLRAGWSGLKISDWNLGFSFSGGATLPISLPSQQVGKITNTSAGARMSWRLPDWNIGTSLGVSTNYNWVVPALGSRGASETVRSYADRSGTNIQPSGCLRREAAELGNLACAYIPAGFGYGVNTGLSWSTLDGQLNFSAALAWMQSFAGNEGLNDEFTPRVDGVQTGLQWKMPATSGTLTASYTPVEWFTLSVGSSSFQSLMTSDLKAVRWFPFWTLPNSPEQCRDGQFCSAAANNLSSLFVDTTVSF